MSFRIYHDWTAKLDENKPTTVDTGTTSITLVEGAKDVRAVACFENVAAPTGATITSAYLRVTAPPGASGQMTASRVLRQDCDPDAICWTNYADATGWTTAGCGDATTDYTATHAVASTTTGAGYSMDIATLMADESDDLFIVRLHTSSGSPVVDRSASSPRIVYEGTLDTPTNLTVTDNGDGTISLAWTDKEAPDYWEVYRGGVTDPTNLINTTETNGYTDAVMPGVYYYRIRAYSTAFGHSSYTASVLVEATGTPTFGLSFGNGLTAGGRSTDFPRIVDHSGMDAPEVEIGAVENGVLDGGTIGASRGKMRRITLLLDFGAGYDRYAVAQLFTPGILRILSSPRGWIPYYVESLSFTSSRLVGDPTRVSVTMVSPYAYPIAAKETVNLTGAATTFPSYSDVDAPGTFTIVVPASSTAIVLTTDGGTTTLNGTYTLADVIVIDSDAHTVTLNGANALDDFDRTGDWPMIGANVASVTCIADATDDCALTVEWNPRLMGLSL